MGTLRMIDGCRGFACPAPEWKEQAGSVYVTFHPAPWFEEAKPGRQGRGEPLGVESGSFGPRPGGTIENSPAIHRWGHDRPPSKPRRGERNHRASLAFSFVPGGTHLGGSPALPSDESLGYHLSPCRAAEVFRAADAVPGVSDDLVIVDLQGYIMELGAFLAWLSPIGRPKFLGHFSMFSALLHDGKRSRPGLRARGVGRFCPHKR